jgi:hypothetical protein
MSPGLGPKVKRLNKCAAACRSVNPALAYGNFVFGFLLSEKEDNTRAMVVMSSNRKNGFFIMF